MRTELDELIDLTERDGILEEQAQRATELRQRLSENELIISVIGQFKRGKSSLINTMLGDDLLPVGIIPLTTVVTAIRHGNRFRAAVRFADGTEREIRREELPEYISEQQNRGNHKNVAAVELWVTSELFGDGVVLVDTPGVGSVRRHNTETSYSFVEKSDAVLFLLSVDSPVSEVEREFLLKTREYASRFYFAVNKTDTISKENQAEFTAYCKSVLSEAVGSAVELYPVSARTGEGVPEIMRKISDDIRTSSRDLLSASIALKVNHIILQAKSKIELYLKAAAIPEGEFRRKASEIREKKLALDSLYPELQLLTKGQTDRLVERIREHLEAEIPRAFSAVRAKAQRCYENLKDLPPRQFESRMTAAVEGFLHDELDRLNAEGLAMLKDGYAAVAGSLDKKAEDAARYVSGLMLECFGVEYPVDVRGFSVSEQNDYYVRISNNRNIHPDSGGFSHFLPRTRVNAKTFGLLMRGAEDDLDQNKNNMLYNYRYKMQESLRELNAEFSDYLAEISSELAGLLGHMEDRRKAERRELDDMGARYGEILSRLDYLLSENTVSPHGEPL